MKISINRNPLGWRNNMVFALCQLGDSLIRTLSFGLLVSDLGLNQSRRAMSRFFDDKKREQPPEELT